MFHVFLNLFLYLGPSASSREDVQYVRKCGGVHFHTLSCLVLLFAERLLQLSENHYCSRLFLKNKLIQAGGDFPMCCPPVMKQK